MLKNLIVLPDGTEIYSGGTSYNNVRSATVKQSVNSETELTLGSVCSAALEITLQTPYGGLNISTGSEIIYYKVDDSGTRTKVGIFTLETPTRSSAHTYKITAYDRASWLDKDLTDWLGNLDGWPYSLYTFAQMICEECGLVLETEEIPNGDFAVNKFQASSVTGRKLMGYIGQLAARFIRATVDGDIEFAWYEPSGVILSPGGDQAYRSLTYEDYKVAKIDAVQIRLAESESGLLWPSVAEGSNTYVLSSNPLITSITEELLDNLQVIYDEIANASYTPGKIVLPARLDIRAGHTVNIVDRNGEIITLYVMTKTTKGQLDTLECTGSARRNSSTAVNNPSDRDLRAYADSAADAAVKRQTQLDIFNKLTNNGQIQGLFIENDGQIYVNAKYIATGILTSKDGTSFYLDLDEGTFYSTGKFMSSNGKSYITVEGSEFVLYAQAGDNGEFIDIIRIGFSEDSEGYDYPYFILGNADEDGSNFDQIGLIKMFRNGLYAGNSAPRLSTGSFVGLTGAAGFFVDTINAIAYVVSGEDMKELYTGTVDATFA